jgi:hypothetical protein
MQVNLHVVNGETIIQEYLLNVRTTRTKTCFYLSHTHPALSVRSCTPGWGSQEVRGALSFQLPMPDTGLIPGWSGHQHVSFVTSSVLQKLYCSWLQPRQLPSPLRSLLVGLNLKLAGRAKILQWEEPSKKTMYPTQSLFPEKGCGCRGKQVLRRSRPSRPRLKFCLRGLTWFFNGRFHAYKHYQNTGDLVANN